MVVDQNHRRSPVGDGRREHLPGVNLAGVHQPHRDLMHLNHLAGAVEGEAQHVFLLPVGDVPDIGEHVLRAPDGKAAGALKPPGEFKGRDDLGGFGLPHTGDGPEIRHRPPGQGLPGLFQDFPGEIQGAFPPHPRAQQDSQEFLVPERLRPPFQEFLPGPAEFGQVPDALAGHAGGIVQPRSDPFKTRSCRKFRKAALVGLFSGVYHETMARKRIRSVNLEKGLPPGQTYVETFPVYDILPGGPDVDRSRYRFSVTGLVENPLSWTMDDLERLLEEVGVEVEADFHCVTRWSKRGLVWEGIPTAWILEQARPKPGAVQVMARSLDGYTTNVPLEYLFEEDSLLALKLNGAWLPREHGAPARLVIPQLYAWKSAKYVTEIVVQDDFVPGFWEVRGYHLIGDPWEEQRYTEPVEKIREWWRKVRHVRMSRSR